MVYYGNHNLAYDFTIFEEAEVRPTAKGKKSGDKAPDSADRKENTPSAKKSEKRAPKKTASRGTSRISRLKRRKSNFGRIAAGVVAGLAVVAVIAAIIHGQVQLTELNQQIIDARAELAEKQSIYTQLEMKVDASISNAAVEEYAQETLKMNKAANSQKEFVSLSEGDKAEVTLESNKNIFERFIEFISSLWS